MSAVDLDRAVAAVAECQDALVTRAQVHTLDGDDHDIALRVAAGRWIVVYAGVYLIAGAPRKWRQGVRAALLAAGDYAVGSHRTAAAAMRLERFGRATIELTVPPGRGPSPEGVVVHRARLEPRDVTVADGLRVTSAPRLLRDLAPALEYDRLVLVADEAMRKRLTTYAEMRAYVEGNGRGVSGMRALRAAVLELGPAAGRGESSAEDLLCLALRRDGLADPVRGFAVYSGRRKLGTLDVCYPEACLAIEPGADVWHTGRRREEDLAVKRQLGIDGWLWLEFTDREVRRTPRACAAQVRTALRRRNPALLDGH